jgi:hypothetical protein
MGLEDITPRSAFFTFVGSAIAVLFMMGGTALWERKYGPALLFWALAAGLTFGFFRKGKIAVVFIGLIFILVNAGLTDAFHPTLAGTLLTIGAALSLVLLARWHER